MKALRAPLLCAAALGGVGCAQIDSMQQPAHEAAVMSTAEQWDVVAVDTATTLRQALASEFAGGAGLAVHVEEPTYHSAFTEAFHDMLVTHLVELGFTVTELPATPVKVRYGTDMVLYPEEELVVTATALRGPTHLAQVQNLYDIAPGTRNQYLAANQDDPRLQLMEVVGP